jgi:hypothetical protein
MTQTPKSRKQSFREDIDRALANSPYKNVDKNLHQIYCIGLLKELLVYSAMDLMEIRRHIDYLAEREPTKPKSGQ